jgi:hemoglobin/transferrin/lactoferrin receptor protein
MFAGSRVRQIGSVSLFVLIAASAVCGPGLPATGAWAAGAGSTAEPTELDDITVTAERRPTSVKDASATVSVKASEDLDRHLVSRPTDLVADEPGVSVGSSPKRAGAGSYTIRGIGDNRVLVEEDGIRVQDYPESQKGPGMYTRDFVDFDNLKQVEIIRGPASALRGSEAIGGVVSFVTKDPEDFLKVTGKDWYLAFKAAYDSADRSLSETTTVAGKRGDWSAVVSYSRRDGEETQAHTSATLNPQTRQKDDVFGKLVWDSPEAGRFRLTFEHMRRRDWTDLKSDLSASVLASTGDDTTSRSRLSLDWSRALDLAFADHVDAKVYWSRLERDEVNPQTRLTSGIERWRTTTADYSQSVWGGDVQFSLHRDWFGLSHDVVWGTSAVVTSTTRLRDRWEINSATGAITRSFSGDVYPNKLFPDTTTSQFAGFAQDTIRWGAFRMIPALRLDYWRLDPSSDQALLNSSASAVSAQSHVALSPKLGLSYDLDDTWRLVAQYARGFRAPPYDSANFAYSNPLYGYQILPNGNLKPETSDGFEIGVRASFPEGSSARATVFYNHYHDFIDTTIVGTSGGLVQYQYTNVSNAESWGAEAKGEWKVNPQWSVNGALAYAHGQNLQTGRPIDSVDPLTGVLGVAWRPDETWTVEGRMRAAAGKTRVSDDATIVKPGGWATFDAFATYDAKPRLTISAGVYNILDKSYFAAQDVAGITRTDPLLETYRATGRTFAVSATVRF